jgi:hypothetical protein
MNLSLNGFAWRTVLRAVPEPSRPEILGTLTECYGDKAPLGEAFRTFTSGSRMRNRLEASSPLDLWRIAIRSALTFSLAIQAGNTLARWFLPFEYKNQTESIWTMFFAFMTLVIATWLARNQYARIAAVIFASTSAIGVLQMDSGSFGHKQFPNLFPVQVISGLAMLVATCFIVWFREKRRWICALGACALAGSQIVAYTNGTELFSERWEMYSMIFRAANVTAFVALITLSTRSLILRPDRPELRGLLPIIMGLGFALLGSLLNSTLLPNSLNQWLGRGLGTGVALLLVAGVILVAVRPRLFLSSAFVFLINVLPVLPWRFSGEGVVAPLALAGVCISVLLIGRSASKRALQV